MAKDPYNRCGLRKIRFTMTIDTAADAALGGSPRHGSQLALRRDRGAGWGARKTLRLRP
jgi:hypothetical protein